MRLSSGAGLLAASLLLFLTGGPVSLAENEDRSRFPTLDQRFRQPGSASQGRQRSVTRPEPRQPLYYPNVPSSGGASYARPYSDPRLARPYPPPQPSYQPLFPFFSAPREAAPPEYDPRQARQYEPQRKKPRRVVPVPKEEAAQEPEVEPSIHVVVFGDSMAELLGHGLDVALEEAEDIAIERKVRGDSGLVRSDVHDWPKVIQDYLNGNPKITYAVVLLGSNDRQAIREGDTSHEPLSERWRELYRQRVDAVVRSFADRKIPLIWVGAPPMRNDRLSADLLLINEIYRDRVQRAGGVYVDIWPGFVDDENRYSATGPDVDGHVAKLRTADGVHFTRAGARKVAHFVDIELKRLIEARAGTAVAAPASPGQQPGQAAPGPADVERLINAAVPSLPDASGLPALPAKPAAGPVMPLTKPELSPGGTLVSGQPRLDGDAAYTTQRALRDGVPPPPRPGRADDFKWPRS